MSLLYLKANEYREAHPFVDVFGATSRAVIEEFASLEEVAAMPLAELAIWLDTQARGRFPDPAKVARELQQVAQDSYPLDPQSQQPINFLTWSFQLVNFLDRQVQRVNTAIADAMRDIPIARYHPRLRPRLLGRRHRRDRACRAFRPGRGEGRPVRRPALAQTRVGRLQG